MKLGSKLKFNTREHSKTNCQSKRVNKVLEDKLRDNSNIFLGVGVDTQHLDCVDKGLDMHTKSCT